jgi:hypothetical protein
MQIKKFALFPVSSFLCTLDHTPQHILANLELSKSDYQWFGILHGHTQNILSALKDFNGKKKTTVTDDEAEV